jgi:hypothetical protein
VARRGGRPARRPGSPRDGAGRMRRRVLRGERALPQRPRLGSHAPGRILGREGRTASVPSPEAGPSDGQGRHHP